MKAVCHPARLPKGHLPISFARIVLTARNLRDDRTDKLPGIVTTASVRAYLTGDSPDGTEPAAFRKHGYRAGSIFRHGSDYLRRILLNMSGYIDEFAQVIRSFSVPPAYFFKSHKLCELR